MADKNIHAGHRKRVKANVYNNGFSQFEEHRLLELMLFYSVPRGDTNPIAHRLLDEFGSLKNLFNASISQLEKIEGVGENTAILLSTVGEIFYRISKETPQKRATYKTTEDVKRLATALLSAENNEKVLLLCFDASHHLKKQAVISEGDKTSADIDMRKTVQTVIDCGASYAVLTHNHPESPAEPSAYDIDSTRAVSVMLRKLGFALADHIVVGGDGSVYSMHSDSRFSAIFY